MFNKFILSLCPNNDTLQIPPNKPALDSITSFVSFYKRNGNVFRDNQFLDQCFIFIYILIVFFVLWPFVEIPKFRKADKAEKACLDFFPVLSACNKPCHTAPRVRAFT